MLKKLKIQKTLSMVLSLFLLLSSFVTALIMIDNIFISSNAAGDDISTWIETDSEGRHIHVDFSPFSDENLEEYEISSSEQLAALCAIVNSLGDNEILTDINGFSARSTDFSNKKIKLISNVNMSNYEWIPIGYIGKTFKGSFDGVNDSCISNLHIGTLENPSNIRDIGLFGCSNGPISNVKISTMKIFANNFHSCGTVVGATSADVTNCSTDRKTRITLCNEECVSSIVGGIIGECYAENKISLCKSNTHILSETQANIFSAGGIIGRYCSQASICNCQNDGSLDLASNNIGGIIGVADVVNSTKKPPIIFKSHNTGIIINCQSDGLSFTGGIVGQINNSPISIIRCTNFTDLIEGQRYVAGILGGLSAKNGDLSCVIEGCRNKANILNSSLNQNLSYGDGIIGINFTIGSQPGVDCINCINEGKIWATNCSNHIFAMEIITHNMNSKELQQFLSSREDFNTRLRTTVIDDYKLQIDEI